jgi:Tol biopolymer transport system component
LRSLRRIEEDRPVRIGRLLAGTIGALLLYAAPASAAFPGGNGRIAFQGDQKLETINSDGGDRRPLIGQAGLLFSEPAWSPDGQRLAFTSNRDGADFEIYVVGAEGGGITTLTSNAAEDFAPTWSPDGRKIAFESDREGRFQIYVMNADGTGVTPLSPSPTEDRAPAWSPDGTRIAFARGSATDHNIWATTASGGTGSPLTADPADESSPDWSPDGASLVFERGDGIATMRADGSAQMLLTQAGIAGLPAWAPDGTRIAFERNSSLYSANPDGGGAVQLTTSGTQALTARNPSWQPIVAPPPPPLPPPAGVDKDRDGVAAPLDCNDSNPAIRPGAFDKPGDKIDQDCNGRDAPFPLLRRTIEAFSATYPLGRYTTFTSMTVKPVRKGDRLRLTCKGPGCEIKKKTIKIRKNAKKLSLLRQLKGSKLRKGAVVRLRVTRPETVGRVGTWRIRAPKVPTTTRSCLQPGAKKLSRCPR